MFTDMNHKPWPEERLRSNLSTAHELSINNQKKNVKAKDSPLTFSPLNTIPVNKSPLNSKIKNKKSDSTKHEATGFKPSSSTCKSPNYPAIDSSGSKKQHHHKQAKTTKKLKQRSPGQNTLVRIATQPVCNPWVAQGQFKTISLLEPAQRNQIAKLGTACPSKASKVSEVKPTTPKSAISTGPSGPKLEDVKFHKPSNDIPRVKQDDIVKTSNTDHPLEDSKKNETDRTQMAIEKLKAISADLSSKLHDPIAVSNAACFTEIARKEYYYRIQQLVEKAIKVNGHNKLDFYSQFLHVIYGSQNHKIFLIRGDIPYLEDSMRSRGWVKKYESTKTRMVPYGSVASLDAPSLGDIHLPDDTLNEKLIIFQMLRHVPPDFIWDCRNDFTDWNSNIKQSTLLNRFQKSFIYTSKLGMAAILEEAHWNYESNVSTVQCPRSYNVGREKNAFVDDYRMTAAVSLLKWFVDQVQKGIEHAVRGLTPIPLRQIEFAIKRCEQLVAEANNEHLDVPQVPVSSQEWEFFVQDYLKAVHQENGFVETTNGPPFTEIEMLYLTANAVLKKVKEVDPQFELNGFRNIWILKPSDLCCGAGIVMTHKLNHIMKRVQNSARDYFVVQKYIEKPLLVQDTKFDVRQWYLVTKSYPLTIWIYKESFLRFSSRPFSFANYHEIVHICNTAVQCRYAEQRNSVRAKDWDCEKINDYLKNVGYKGEPWYDEVYPRMCEAIIATMLAAQQHMDKRRCSFELYGADFVIMDDLSVWLIEINTNPRMHPPSTRVTERLYPEVMESLIKVILDYPACPTADTGNFVLAYQQNVTTFQPYLGASMFVLGNAINPKSQDSHDRENSINSWALSVKERQNGTTLLVPQKQREGELGLQSKMNSRSR